MVVVQFFLRLPLDQPAEVLCETCSDPYCEVCFAAQHRKGSRKSHTVKPLVASKKGVKVEVNREATAATNDEPVSDVSYPCNSHLRNEFSLFR
jgi:hypothetical protein